jgi:hypothetical protein
MEIIYMAITPMNINTDTPNLINNFFIWVSSTLIVSLSTPTGSFYPIIKNISTKASYSAISSSHSTS